MFSFCVGCKSAWAPSCTLRRGSVPRCRVAGLCLATVRRLRPGSEPRRPCERMQSADTVHKSRVRMLHTCVYGIVHAYTASYMRIRHPICVCGILYAYTASCMRMLHPVCVYGILYAYAASYMRMRHPVCVCGILHAYTASYMRMRHPVCVYGILYAYTASYMRIRHPECIRMAASCTYPSCIWLSCIPARMRPPVCVPVCGYSAGR